MTEQRSSLPLPMGLVLNQTYVLEKILGAGGFGITYLAWDTRYTRAEGMCAVKEYFPREWAVRCEDGLRIISRGWKVDRCYRHGLEVYINEAKILRGLHQDETIVDIKDFFLENNTAYLVMEYVRGRTLAEYMAIEQKAFPVWKADEIIRKIAASLAYVHQHGLLHRDVSPDNIMLLDNGAVKLIDFGATRQFVLDETTDMSVVIKPGFAPLEQYSRTGKQGPWTDVYALAATYYYIVSGKKPLAAVDRCAGSKIKPLHQISPQISPEVSRVILQAMEIDYTKRIKSIKQLIDMLERAEKASGMREGTPHVLMKMNNQIRKWKFDSGRSIRIGRSGKECDITVEGSRFSRIHCEVRYDRASGRFIVTDCSVNGTYTEHGLIGKGSSAALRPGESFYLVARENQFFLEVK